MRAISLLVVLILFVSCKKEKLDLELPIIGKWGFTGVVSYSSEIPLWLHYPNWTYAEFKHLTLEITSEGKLIYSSDLGKVVFRIVKNEIVNYQVNYSYTGSTIDLVKGHLFTIRDFKGKKFKFKMFYDPVVERLISVAWYKGLSYNTSDTPVTNGYYYDRTFYGYNGSYPSNWKGWGFERLGVFEKI